MPFENSDMDEKIEGRPPASKSLEAELTRGCFQIILISLGVFFFFVWPFIIFQDTHTMAGLTKALLVGPLVSILAGAGICYGLKTAGATGYLGGIFASCIFLFLRMQQIMLGEGQEGVAQPEYPGYVVFALPLAIVALAFAIALIFTRVEKESTGS